ncbi:peptidylprolyl isomerase [Geobacter pickeringii]|uniref:peptidylprolyl isomerase n=1 Tax=Geobacter pickeringii TaxID=345632 RepID=A0A0B5BFC7_9BACT|nr:peptidylprolyl isomerase [Geobacter pickeringii]AJE03240.1 hypothetical protein GPICK_07635 [Geobacter pickeringii]
MNLKSVATLVYLGSLLIPLPALATNAGDRPAATVNGVTIAVAEYRQELDRALRTLGTDQAKISESRIAELKRETLDDLIGRQLLYSECVVKGIVVPRSEVDAQLAQLRKQFAGEKEFSEALATAKLDEESLRRQLVRGMTLQRYITREFAPQVKVTDDDVEEYYESHRKEFHAPLKVRMSHILIRLKEGDSRTQAEETLKRLRSRAVVGEDFAALAREFSQCFSRDRGGDLGYFSPGELKGEMEKATFSLPKNGVSDVVEDRFGLHLVKVTDIQPERDLPYTEVSDRIREDLRRRRTADEVARHVRKLREKATVELLLKDEE